MNSPKNVNGKMWKWSVMAFIFLAVMLRVVSDGLAATVTAAPESVEAAKLQAVMLRIEKPDGSIDPSLMEQVQFVKVGDQQAKFKKEAEWITMLPPKLNAGTQPLQLLDKGNKEIAKGEIRYQSVASTSESEWSDQEFSRRKEEARRDALAQGYWYYFLVTGMFAAVIFPFVLAIYRGTSGSMATGNRPLGLPVGSFRSILAYSLVAYLGFFVLTSILSVSAFTPPDFLLGIVATVIGFYFGSRSGDEGKVNLKGGNLRGIVRHGANPARGAIVKFKRSEDGTEPYSRISDAEGRFELRGATTGKYKLTASLSGITPSSEQEISIGEGSDHEIEIIIGGTVPEKRPAAAGIVQGTVTKPDGKPASKATIVLSQGGVEKFKETADDSGIYKIINVAAGEYDAEALLAPHNPSDKETVNVSSGKQHKIDLRLK